MSIHLLRGCPGAGKTTRLNAEAARAVATYGASSVAVASLTTAAAAEIAGKDNNAVPDHNIGTLHAHAYRALECGRDEMAETRARMREFAAAHPELDVGDDTGADLDDTMHDGSGTHAAVQNHRARLTAPEHWAEDERAYHTAWTAWKRHHGLRDFTDLIERVAAEPELMPRVQGLFFDESQDFSALELKLALGWARHAKTTVICADIDQAIYQWRGADPAALEALLYGVTIPLLQSYRCSHAVTDLALRWIEQIPGRTPVTWQPTEREGHVTLAPFALRDSADMLDQIKALDGSVMVLASCGYMLDPLLAALRERGVPFANPHRLKETRWNPLRGKVADGLRAYLVTDRHTYGEDTRPRTWADLHAWAQLVTARGNLARGAKAAIEEHCRTDQFGVSHTKEPVPLVTLIELLGDTAHPALRNDIGWLAGALSAKHQRAGQYLARVYERDPVALLREPSLCIGSVHSAKGASSDHVLLCPELSKEGYYGEAGWLGNGADAVRRLMYVGMTRARDSVHVLESAVPEYAPVEDLLRRYERRAA